MTANAPGPVPTELAVRSFDDPLGRRIVDLHIWAVEEGLRGAAADALFEGYCARLVAGGAPLWRAHAAMETLHPQWSAYGCTWRRDAGVALPEQYAHGGSVTPDWLQSPFFELIRRAQAGEVHPTLRRRLEVDAAQRDFPILEDLFAEGATDYCAFLFGFGDSIDRSQGSGIVYSFAADRTGGFTEDDATLLQTTLPALSLAMKAHAGHVIASGLLETYLGADAGRRVHAGAVERGSVTRLRAVLWYADIRGFTPTTDRAPAEVVIGLLNDVFETMTAALRSRGGQVLKFLGDGMLATFSFDGPERAETCRRALDAAIESSGAIDALNAARAAAGLPVAAVDLALHVGEVLYGNVGASDRLDFTVIGAAVNEVARMEALCEPLGRAVLVSAEFAAALAADDDRLRSLGRHALRGVREPKELFAFAATLASG